MAKGFALNEELLFCFTNQDFLYLLGKPTNYEKEATRNTHGTLIGTFVIFCAYSHSPKAGVVKIIGNELAGSYTMSET
jgi:hypothetical protein